MTSAKTVTLEAFQELLRTGNLLSLEELAGILAEMTHLEFAATTDFARWLVERKWITRWQAQMMLAGSNRFFLGKYKLLERIGAGGMGTVFKAQQQGLGRFVALKVMAEALVGDESSVARFHREIRSAAALEHPNIVTTFDADCVGGKHFLVMEFVDGNNLQAVAKQRGQLPMEEACEYIRQAALGLAHAHERGMIHRDIKPANLLVSFPPQLETGSAVPGADVAGQPVVKILDFGLARLANETHVDAALTETGQIMGTADYIAPEQARDTKAADIRSDIYSLGCTLFRLLAGEVPFQGQSVMEKLMARAMGDAPRIRTLRAELPAELDECLARMVAREPAARLQTPAEVAAAMAHFAAAPVNPVPFSLREAASTWVMPASGRGLEPASDIDPGLQEFLAVLATDADGDSGRADLAEDTSPTGQGSGSGGATRVNNPFARVPKKKPGAARRTSTSSQRLLGKDRGVYGKLAIPAVLVVAVAAGLLWYRSGTTWVAVDWPDDERKGGTLEIDGREPILAGKLAFPGRAGTRRLRLERKGYEPIEEEWQLARGETVHFRPEWKMTPLTARRREAAALKAEIETLGLAPGDSLSRGKSPETDALREKCSAFIGRWLNTPEAAQIAIAFRTLPAPVDGLNRAQIPEYELRVSGGGDAAAAPAELVAVIGDSRLKHAGNIPTVAFSPDDTWVAAGDEAGFVKLWDAATGEEVRSIKAHDNGVTRLAFSPDGTTLLTGSNDGTAKLWGLPALEERKTLRGHTNQIRTVAWNPVADLVATAGTDQTIRLWKPSDGTLVSTIDEGLGQVASLAFSPDGKSLAVGCHESSTAFIFEVADGNVRHKLSGHQNAVLAVAFNRDGSRLATGGYEPELKLWNTATGEAIAANGLRYTSGISAIDFSADGKVMAVGVGDGTVVLQDATTGAQEQVLRRHESGLWTMAFSHRGRKLVTAGPEREIRICDTTTGKEVVTTGPKIQRIEASSDGRYLALGLHDGAVGVWDIAARMRSTLRGHSQPASALAFSPDSRLLAAGTYGGGSNLRIWDVASQSKLAVIEAHFGTISGLTFSADGQTLASASHDGLVKFWDPENGSLKETIDEKSGGVSGMTLSADWRTLVLGFNPHQPNGVAKIIDRTGERKTQTLDGDWGAISSVVFGAEDKTLTAGFPGHGVKFWNLAKGTERGVLVGTGLFALNADASLVALDTKTSIVLCDPVLGTALAEVSPGRAELPVEQLLFTPEGRHLAVLLGDGTLHILQLPGDLK